jgi:hypothetical protein
LAVLSPPVYLQNASLPSSTDRAVLAALLRGTLGSPRPGVLPTGATGESAINVTASTPADNKVTVPGMVVVIPDAGIGAYIGVNDAPLAVTVPAAHATLDRKDLVVAQVADSTLGGSVDTFTIVTVSGTPAASPAAPAVPARSVSLAEVFVTHGGSTVIASGNIVQKATLTGLRGTVVPSTAARMPATAEDPELRVATDTGRAYVSVPGVTPYPISHPSHVIDANGNLTTPNHTWQTGLGSNNVFGSIDYRVLDGRLQFRGSLDYRNYPSTTTGLAYPADALYLVVTLPAGYRPTGTRYGTVRFVGASYNGFCEVRNNGEIYVRSPAGSSTTTAAFDGITFTL